MWGACGFVLLEGCVCLGACVYVRELVGLTLIRSIRALFSY